MFKLFAKDKKTASGPVQTSVASPAKSSIPAQRLLPATATAPQLQRPQPQQQHRPQAGQALQPRPQQRPQTGPAAQALRVKRRDLTDIDRAVLAGDKSEYVLQSAPGAVAEISKAQSEYVALLRFDKKQGDFEPGNTFVVAKDFLADPETSTVRHILRRKGITVHHEVLADMGTVRAIYERAHALSPQLSGENGGAAQMQQEFIRLLDIAARASSSDIHVIVRKYDAIIKLRTDGVMMKLSEMASGKALELCNAVFNMTETSEATYKPLDYQQARMTESSLKGLKFPSGVQAVRLQFNPLPSGGRYMVCRLLYEQKVGSNADIDELGYSINQIADIRTMRRKTIGINIICGPTGSGKSTTLQRNITATIRERTGINVVTIEDPPEYIIEGAVQLPVVNAITAEERSRNFALAMNAALRDDPDLIMVGEIRDHISGDLAVEAAQTGHGVWASLHANNAIGILDRLRDLGVDLWKLCDASLFTGLISQRLIRKIEPGRKIDVEEARRLKLVDDETFALLEMLAGDRIKDVRFANTSGLPNPHDAFKGRTVCAETVKVDQKFLDTYRRGEKSEALAYWKAELGGMDMLEHAFALILMGIVDVRTVEEYVGLLSDIDPTRIPKIIELVGI
jgi:general secretion pathway protein E